LLAIQWLSSEKEADGVDLLAQLGSDAEPTRRLGAPIND
jgi:hypothetical protein